MALLTISYYEEEKLGMSCETLINPATRRLYAITRIANGDNNLYFPLSADMTRSDPGKALQPIAIPSKPGQVYACGSSDEARMVLETHDELYATHPPVPSQRR